MLFILDTQYVLQYGKMRWPSNTLLTYVLLMLEYGHNHPEWLRLIQ
jgi:hypothetical protein